MYFPSLSPLYPLTFLLLVIAVTPTKARSRLPLPHVYGPLDRGCPSTTVTMRVTQTQTRIRIATRCPGDASNNWRDWKV